MTKLSNLSCMMAAVLCLAAGIVHAADDTETQQAGPTVASTSENPAKPKENAASTNSSQSNTTETKEEPACN
ncbi:hypothetical protein [Thiobacillus denitrificans]|uniref:hypothetical protein n=1 Tax=Thiobacillus denitrificans TaxID=36861 RepID=UPI0003A7C2ED|nr:hypothetical protein [Thiobacillus denitrificans]